MERVAEHRSQSGILRLGRHAESDKKVFAKRAGEISYTNFSDWDDFLIVFRDVKADDCMWVIFSRKEGLSYDPVMPRIPGYLNKYFQGNSFVLSYPIQASMDESTRYLT